MFIQMYFSITNKLFKMLVNLSFCVRNKLFYSCNYLLESINSLEACNCNLLYICICASFDEQCTNYWYSHSFYLTSIIVFMVYRQNNFAV